MKLLRLNPYLLRITDPLVKLMENRFNIMKGFGKGIIPPVYVFPSNTSTASSIPNAKVFYLIFNGNKRTIIAREMCRSLLGNVIENDHDLFDAQNKDPRVLLPSDISFNFRDVQYHLEERANYYSKLNYRCSPISITDSKKRIRLEK